MCRRCTYFFPGNLHVVLDVSKDGGLDEVADLALAITSGNALSTLLLTSVDVAHNLVEHLQVNLETVKLRMSNLEYNTVDGRL